MSQIPNSIFKENGLAELSLSTSNHHFVLDMTM